MMILTIVKLNLALKVEAPPKPTIESSVNEKKFYDDKEYSNSFCLMIMIWKTLFMQAFPRLGRKKGLLDAISKKYTKFSKNEKNELSDNYWVSVCFESNVIDVLFDTWWLYSGATIHAFNSMQAVISRRSPTTLEKYLYMEDGTGVQVDFMGVVRL